MKLSDGRELLVHLELPLPLTLACALMSSIARAAERNGYTDVVMLTDGEHAGGIAATPPS